MLLTGADVAAPACAARGFALRVVGAERLVREIGSSPQDPERRYFRATISRKTDDPRVPSRDDNGRCLSARELNRRTLPAGVR
jgi:hypothetical protein